MHAAISHQDTGGRRVPAVSGREVERKDCHGANIFRAGLRVIKRGGRVR